MVNAYWEQLNFDVQEGKPEDWMRIVDTALASPEDFSEHGEPLKAAAYSVAPRSVVVLVKAKR
jgi:isoamylase